MTKESSLADMLEQLLDPETAQRKAREQMFNDVDLDLVTKIGELVNAYSDAKYGQEPNTHNVTASLAYLLADVIHQTPNDQPYAICLLSEQVADFIHQLAHSMKKQETIEASEKPH